MSFPPPPPFFFSFFFGVLLDERGTKEGGKGERGLIFRNNTQKISELSNRPSPTRKVPTEAQRPFYKL